jgi:hypothetical protein
MLRTSLKSDTPLTIKPSARRHHAETGTWMSQHALPPPYEHRADNHLAFLQLGCALLPLRFIG